MEPSPADKSPKRWLLAAAGVFLFLILVLNSESVEVNFVLATAEMPLFVALAIAAALGALVGWAAPRLRGPRK